MSSNEFNETIYTFTTKQAVEEGVLVKIDPAVPKEIGIKYPVYLTDTVHRRYVEVPADAKDHQDYEARLYDLLFMFAMKARHCETQTMYFEFVCLLRRDSKCTANEMQSDLSPYHKEVNLKAVINVQDIDDASPAIFIMLPSED